jgi:hypothetical protein
MPKAEPSALEQQFSIIWCQRSPTDWTATIVDCHTQVAWKVRTEAELLSLLGRLIGTDTASASSR